MISSICHIYYSPSFLTTSLSLSDNYLATSSFILFLSTISFSRVLFLQIKKRGQQCFCASAYNFTAIL
nr:MAG TPA: hypothetical protein [Caudoviricetes sp.]